MEDSKKAQGAPLTPPDKFPDSEITNDTHVIFLRNTQLAAALVAVGIPLRKDPPYTYRIEKKQRIIFWHFESQDSTGMFQTLELVKAWKKDLQWMAENPMHPFAFAMASQKVFRILNEEAMNPNELLWCEANPQSPASIAMQGAHNFAQMASHIARDIPFVCFRPKDSRATISVKEGSQKHRNCIESGFVQI